ncbi:hypothetical protein E0485_22305 [Paenibacillus albiflavus]|uniref:Uncharacterized protein n=1 Tax=Paenibacillus albiflavus TaxID=2545760 RepID=A0A4R4E506_9BACL|nr:hypothetical protein [Paenibacillus albiflavus]TCZ72320.1 hypothetical protein E0485_22305 [Paenibacillus albiflavus]
MKKFHKMLAAITILGMLSFLVPNMTLAAQVIQSRSDPTIYLIVKSSPDANFTTQTQFRSANLLKELKQTASGPIAPLTLIADTVIHFHHQNQIIEYDVTSNGIVFDRTKHQILPLSKKTADQLQAEVQKIRNQHYGELISWDDLRTQIPKFAKFSITDLETGLTYQVQRRAGSSHIDAQPLTSKDSNTMKKIYNDKWSWDRRAVLIQYKDHSWAGSINGMPHGGDGIPSNDFKGHFCIHFKGSRTHKNNHLDLAHQVMNYKAAGKLEEFVQNLTPEQIAELWKFASNKQDQAILKAITWLGNPVYELDERPDSDAASAPKRAKKTKKQKRNKPKQKSTPIIRATHSNLIALVPVTSNYTLPNHKHVRGTIYLRMVRTSPMDRWVIYQIEK